MAAYDAATVAAIREAAATRLSELLASPKPSYSIDGQSVSWGDYHERLTKQIEWATKELSRLESGAASVVQVMRSV